MKTSTQILRVLAIGLLAAIALLYAGDTLSLRFGFPGNRAQFSTVRVKSMLAVPRKDGRTEFLPGDAQDQQCVNSLFPHGGYQPCWYLKRHANQQVNM